MQWFFARRYLVSRSSHSVINIIAGVSLISVAIPVAAMVILLSVFNGFEILEKISRKRGFILKGNEVDLLRGANVVLDEYRGAKLGKITLE